MKQKARLKAIQKAAHTRAGEGQPVTEIIIYTPSDDGENHTIIYPSDVSGTKIFLPDNGRGGVQETGQP
jgi:hypothetical protein